MKITLKDNTVIEYDHPVSAFEVAQGISEGLARMACAAEINGKLKDLRTVIDSDVTLNILTAKDEGGIKTLRHTASHVMAEAVKRIRPGVKVAIGPAIENGWYYDFDTEPFTREDLDKIEAEMKKIIKEGHEITRYTLPREEAIARMEAEDEPYKAELIRDLPEDAIISFYDQGGFTDLCAGPHLMTTKPVKYFKLTSSSGAYWRGSEKNKMLTRIYGAAFNTKDELADYLKRLEEARMRDHNRLGREMGLFTTVDVIGQGLPLMMPKGAAIIQTMQRWIEDEEERRGYMRTKTPLMAKRELYIMSDHWNHYKEGMFILGDTDKQDDPNEEIFALRPMTCPFQYMIYKAEPKSYRDLPCRYGETSTLFRNESSGEMHGLTRVRQFTISEGHLVIRPDQTEDEFRGCVDLMNYCLTTLGLQDDVTYRLSLWDPENADHYLGDAEKWDEVQNFMRKILDDLNIDYKEGVGEAAFYGPKLDVQAKNVYGKEDTMITIQLDMFLAERYDMTYTDKDGLKKRPYIIHRTSVGCYERTLAWLIEKYAGKFPTWLCPEQVRVLPISEKFMDYAYDVCNKLKAAGIKATVDTHDEKIGYKIRMGWKDKLPYQVIVGQKEAEDGSLVSVRSRFAGDEGQKKLDDFIADLKNEIDNKIIRPEEPKEEFEGKNKK
ncbi:MAG: threonine--tRNA ligase [Lachnospiraceae bacterium]|nr:threonine--tRNA ligase [Lachnospiraceae bacterium]